MRRPALSKGFAAVNSLRPPTLADVAAHAGVSATTVSRVLNNRGYLSDAVKTRVHEAMEALDYRPNEVARALHGRSTQTVGVIVPSVALPFFGELSKAIEEALTVHGYRILLCNSMGRPQRERDYIDLLRSQRVDGLITGGHNDSLVDYERLRMPVVSIDRDLSPAITNVRSDNFAGGVLATEHLLEGGARRPLLLTSRSGPHNLREAGYLSVMKEQGLFPHVITVDFHLPDVEKDREIFAALEAVRGEHDGVFATDDLSAATALEWARQAGLRLPEEWHVVGFDGTAAVRRALPGLSTIQQPIDDLGAAAVRALLPQMEYMAAVSAAGPGTAAAKRLPTPPQGGVVELPVTLLQGRSS